MILVTFVSIVGNQIVGCIFGGTSCISSLCFWRVRLKSAPFVYVLNDNISQMYQYMYTHLHQWPSVKLLGHERNSVSHMLHKATSCSDPTIHATFIIRFFNCFTGHTLTHGPPITTKVAYENSLGPDETPSNSSSHPELSCLTPRQHFHQLWAKLKYYENFSRW